MKIKNKSKNRNATANEIAKQLIIDRLDSVFYFQDEDYYQETYNQEFLKEIYQHLEKHCKSIEKKLNPNNNHINLYNR